MNNNTLKIIGTESIEKIDTMLNDLKQNESALIDLTEFKNDQDVQYEKNRDELEHIEKKLIFIDKTLFEGG